jgi:hypothetical protein
MSCTSVQEDPLDPSKSKEGAVFVEAEIQIPRTPNEPECPLVAPAIGAPTSFGACRSGAVF